MVAHVGTPVTVLGLPAAKPDIPLSRPRTGLRPALLAGVSIVALLLVHRVAVWTAAGQRWDANPMLGRWSSRPTDIEALATQLDAASVAVMVAAGLAGLWMLHRRRDRLTSVVTIGAVVGANVTTQLLKRVLDRPALIDDSPLQSFPSGHTTGAASLLMAVVVLAGASDRPAAALCGLAGIEVVGVGVVAAGWHRPSDAVGAVLICTAWIGAAAAVIERVHGPAPAAPRAGGATRLGRASFCGLLGAAAVMTAAEVTRRGVSLLGGRYVDEGRILGQAAVVVVVTTVAVAALTWCVGGGVYTAARGAGEASGGADRRGAPT